MIWDWEAKQITQTVQQAIQLRHHPQEWKRARGVLLEKVGKRDLTLVKSYRVISFLNCMCKLVEKSYSGTVITAVRKLFNATPKARWELEKKDVLLMR